MLYSVVALYPPKYMNPSAQGKAQFGAVYESTQLQENLRRGSARLIKTTYYRRHLQICGCIASLPDHKPSVTMIYIRKKSFTIPLHSLLHELEYEVIKISL